jgi:hypothetical protein
MNICLESGLIHWYELSQKKGKIIDFQEVGFGDMDRIELTQDRDRWWAVVNAAMNLRFP